VTIRSLINRLSESDARACTLMQACGATTAEIETFICLGYLDIESCRVNVELN
jgi:hypothetical protein